MESEKNDALVPEEQLNQHVEDTVDATPATANEVVEEVIEVIEVVDVVPAVDFSEEEALLAADSIDLGEEEEAEDVALPSVDYSGHSLQELVADLELIITKGSDSPRREIEAIKVAFYKRLRSDMEAKKAEFVKAGGDELEFKAPDSSDEQKLKDLIMSYKNANHLKSKEIEAGKEKNHKEKLQILEA